MDLINGTMTSIFDVLMSVFGLAGPTVALILISGVFGILALICFKYISWQGGIKGTKDKIKGGMIAIRLYQNDLGIVAKSVATVLGRNFQYLGLNFGPIFPLLVPFTLVAAQLVVRFGFDPVPLTDMTQGQHLAGQGTVLEVAMAEGDEARVADLEIELPATLQATSKLVRVPSEGRAWIEFVAIESGVEDILIRVGDTELTKQIVTGDAERPAVMQPERVGGFFAAWLWPAEKTTSGTPVEHIKFTYPDRTLPWMGLLPGGAMGVLTIFLIASMLFGVLILKPLGIQI
ncbi:hypothetical protein [Engelhardtia mirabilis]|uniref:Uncharacterized protein n=1 Tax=Engelhardtia mirabilis TaxID=2528011 RepID=A0A518BFS7_9BACT|nr:hypothetical protein Pla133_09060 [Planctomycetes bacterium Pla133]QDV00166.1 hypothetical protein Pla86_09050 [Planctomycetes bacterium Pla86]